MILNVFIFQVFVGVLVLACEHPKKKIKRNGDLLLKPFKNKINSLFIENNQNKHQGNITQNISFVMIFFKNQNQNQEKNHNNTKFRS